MASYQGIVAVGETLLQLLKEARSASSDPVVSSVSCEFFVRPVPTARPLLTLHLHRVTPGVRGPQPDRPGPSGTVLRPVANVELHYLLASWAATANDQHVLLGWAVQTLATSYQLPAALLNRHRSTPVFFEDESVEIVPDTLAIQDLGSIWEVSKPDIQVAAAYRARSVTLHAPFPAAVGGPVQTRRFEAEPSGGR